MREKPAVVTEVPENPDRDLHSRMIKYSVTMGIRVVCIGLCLVAYEHGWWLAVPAVGAIVLPYFAVVIANAARPASSRRVERPGVIEHLGTSDTSASHGTGSTKS